jgi:hypothetical protein
MFNEKARSTCTKLDQLENQLVELGVLLAESQLPSEQKQSLIIFLRQIRLLVPSSQELDSLITEGQEHILQLQQEMYKD